MKGKVLSEDESEDELNDVCDAQDTPKLEYANDLLVVLAGEVAEGEEDGQVEGQHFAWSHSKYLAKDRSDERKAI